MQNDTGLRRVIIEAVQPAIDAGRFPIKRTINEQVVVEADIFTDGHDLLSAVLRYRPATQVHWTKVPMLPLGNDRWQGYFTVSQLGRYCYTVQAWGDPFATMMASLYQSASCWVWENLREFMVACTPHERSTSAW